MINEIIINYIKTNKWLQLTDGGDWSALVTDSVLLLLDGLSALAEIALFEPRKAKQKIFSEFAMSTRLD